MRLSDLNPFTWSLFTSKPAASSASASSGSTAPGIGATATTMAPAPTTSSSEPANIYVETFKECFTKPDKTVLKHPIKSLTYHVAIKILFYFIAQTFPIFGWAAIAFSAALFDRVVLLNLKKYPNAILDSLKDAWKYISDKWSKAKPAPVPAASSTPPTPPESSTAGTPPAAASTAAPSVSPAATSTTGTS